MTKQLPKRGKNSDAAQAAKEYAIVHERPTMPECPASIAPPMMTPELTASGSSISGRHSRVSMGGEMSWPPPQVTPARDVLLCAIVSLLLALVYLHW
jgi:hypothetical protein